MSNYLKIAMASEQNPELARRVQTACEIRGEAYSHDLYKKVLKKNASKLLEVSEVVRIDASEITDANIDTALNQIFPDEED